MSLVSSAHGVGQLTYHFEWCTKYRYRALRQDRFKDVVVSSLLREAEQNSLTILELGVEDEHVHVVVNLRPTHRVSGVLEFLKARSAEALFEAEPKFRFRYPRGSIWSPGKFYRTVGDVDLKVTREYVRKQDHRQRKLASFS